MSQGISKGIFSEFFIDQYPKFIWSIDAQGEVFEARTDEMTPGIYHGYPLEDEDDMRRLVKQAWISR